MEEIIPQVFHWTTFHEDIGQEVHSYGVRDLGPVVLIDPMVPAEGLGGSGGRPGQGTST